MSHNINIRSEWKAELLDSKGRVKQVVDWTKNTITINGINLWATEHKGLIYSSTPSEMQIHKMAFGSGTTTALWSNTALRTEVYRADIDETLSSATVDVVDPTAPFITLGATIPSGEGPFTINEIGLYAYKSSTDEYKLFNRIVLPVTISKMSEDTLNVQCKITMSYAYSSTPQELEVDYAGGALNTYSTAQTVILSPGIQRIFMNDWLKLSTASIQIGSSNQAPSVDDTGVITNIGPSLTSRNVVTQFGWTTISGITLVSYDLSVIGTLNTVPALTTIRECALVSDGIGFRTVLGSNMTTQSVITTNMTINWLLRFTQ